MIVGQLAVKVVMEPSLVDTLAVHISKSLLKEPVLAKEGLGCLIVLLQNQKDGAVGPRWAQRRHTQTVVFSLVLIMPLPPQSFHPSARYANTRFHTGGDGVNTWRRSTPALPATSPDLRHFHPPLRWMKTALESLKMLVRKCVFTFCFFVSDEGCELAVLTSALQSLPLTNGLDQTVAR